MNGHRTLELILEHGDEELRLLSPGVGHFTAALPEGRLVSPGAELGALRVLSSTYRLLAPAGAFGRIASAAPPLVKEPVDFRRPLYVLQPLDGELGEATVRTDTASTGGLVVRAAYAGRFWHRPAPSEPPLVSAGDAVEDGSTVGLIEVMKTFSAVPYRAEGGLPARARVVRLIAGDGDEVETGSPLVEVEPA